jgi:hypothetical protein
MRSPWDVLCEAGVPDGALRPAPAGALDVTAVGAALRTLAAGDRLATAKRDCLGAWLGAFRRHWPDQFGAMFGPLGESLFAECTTGDVDLNRYLKLRRIAIANLARLV